MTLLFIFDMDQVLYDYNWKIRMGSLTAHTGLSLEELRRRWWHEEGEFAAEAGLFQTGDEYIEAFCEAIGQRVDKKDWARMRGSAMTPWPESIAAVERASQLGQITLLTNNGALAGEHLSEWAPDLAALFGDHLRTSSFYGARKPSTAVFESVLERYGVDAGNTFFADDMAINVEAAASLGIDAHLFTTSAGMHAAIEEFAASRS